MKFHTILEYAGYVTSPSAKGFNLTAKILFYFSYQDYCLLNIKLSLSISFNRY